MKKISHIIAAVVMVCSLSAYSLQAYGYQDEKEPAASEAYVAMLFNKMVKKKPDFVTWAKGTKQYAESSRFDREIVLRQLVDEAEIAFNSINPDEPFYIDAVMTVSKYSESNGGYFFETLNEETMFFFEYMGIKYVVVPRNTKDFQWARMGRSKSQDVEKFMPMKRNVNVQFRLDPVAAEGRKRVVLKKEKYWLLLADIKEMSIWSYNWSHAFWNSDDRDF